MRIINLNNPDTTTWQSPETLLVFTTQAYAPDKVASLKSQFPTLNIFGISSSHGLLLPDGFKRGTYGLLLEREDDMPLRIMAIDLSETRDIRKKVADELSIWKNCADTQSRVFFHATPGMEERIIEGIQDAFANDVIIFGATSGQDSFLPQGFCFYNEICLTKGVVVIEQRHRRSIRAITCGGYFPTLRRGGVTASEGRTILTIDGKPAADVYDEWTDGMFSPYIRRGGPLPKSSALYPFGRKLEKDPECGFWLSHPYETNRSTKAIKVYAEIPDGASIQLMRGTPESTVTHTETAIRQALSLASGHTVKAAVMMYCAGCASAISSQMNEVCAYAHKAFGEIPFIGCTTYGEQGRHQNASQNYHGNMMIEIILILDGETE